MLRCHRQRTEALELYRCLKPLINRDSYHVSQNMIGPDWEQKKTTAPRWMFIFAGKSCPIKIIPSKKCLVDNVHATGWGVQASCGEIGAVREQEEPATLGESSAEEG